MKVSKPLLLWPFPSLDPLSPLSILCRSPFRDGIFSENAKEHEIGRGGKMHIPSADELKSEFDPHGLRDVVTEVPQVRGFS